MRDLSSNFNGTIINRYISDTECEAEIKVLLNELARFYYEDCLVQVPVIYGDKAGLAAVLVRITDKVIFAIPELIIKVRPPFVSRSMWKLIIYKSLLDRNESASDHPMRESMIVLEAIKNKALDTNSVVAEEKKNVAVIKDKKDKKKKKKTKSINKEDYKKQPLFTRSARRS